MIVFRGDSMWEAHIEIDTEDEFSMDWWATAIAALDRSVDIGAVDS